MAAEKNVALPREWAGIVVRIRSDHGMSRFKCFPYLNSSFVNYYGGVIKVNGMVMGPCMVSNS